MRERIGTVRGFFTGGFIGSIQMILAGGLREGKNKRAQASRTEVDFPLLESGVRTAANDDIAVCPSRPQH